MRIVDDPENPVERAKQNVVGFFDRATRRMRDALRRRKASQGGDRIVDRPPLRRPDHDDRVYASGVDGPVGGGGREEDWGRGFGTRDDRGSFDVERGDPRSGGSSRRNG